MDEPWHVVGAYGEARARIDAERRRTGIIDGLMAAHPSKQTTSALKALDKAALDPEARQQAQERAADSVFQM